MSWTPAAVECPRCGLYVDPESIEDADAGVCPDCEADDWSDPKPTCRDCGRREPECGVTLGFLCFRCRMARAFLGVPESWERCRGLGCRRHVAPRAGEESLCPRCLAEAKGEK